MRSPASLVLALAIGAAPAAGAPAAKSGAEPASRPAVLEPGLVHPYFLERVRAALAPPSKGTPRVQEEVVADLVRLGPDAVPTLFAFLTGEALEQMQLDRAAEIGWAAPDPAEIGSSSRQDVAILEALGGIAPGPVLSELRFRATGDAPLALRLIAMRVLERVDSPDALALWLEVAEGIEPTQRERTYVQNPLESALAHVLAEDERALRELERRASVLDITLVPIVARSVGAAGREEGIDVLGRMLGRSSATDAVLLAEVSRLAGTTYSARIDEALFWIRPMVDSRDEDVRRQAVVTVGDLADLESVPAVIERLEDDDRLVRRNALLALERISGLKLGAEPRAWALWLAGQRRWRETEGARLIETLASDDPVAVVAAVQTLSQRRLFGDELVADLAQVLWRDEVEVVRATCAALGRLGSRRAAPYLLDALRDPEETVRDSAWRALKVLTSQDLPPEHDVWAERLQI